MIKKKHRILLSSSFIVMMIFILMYWMNTAKLNVMNIEPKFHVQAENLIHDFTFEKGIADSALVESVISVEGIIKEITILNNRRTIFLKGSENATTSVLCDMQNNQINRIQRLVPGDTIQLKGVFKGFLKDVILLDCIITKNE